MYMYENDVQYCRTSTYNHQKGKMTFWAQVEHLAVPTDQVILETTTLQYYLDEILIERN